VRNAGIKQHTLSGGCFTGVNMGHDADISITLDGRSTSHSIRSLLLLPAVVSEGFVGLGHTVRIFALLRSRTAILSRIDQLTSQTLNH